MTYDPFDGVLLGDARPPVPGAMSMLLHLTVARRQAKARGWSRPNLNGLKARAQACRDLLTQGLDPTALRVHGVQGPLRAHRNLAGLHRGGGPSRPNGARQQGA